MSTLYIVSTPIGHLGDITHRAVETLRSVDLVLCEDTRVTRKLLSAYDVHVDTMSYHHHSDDGTYATMLGFLQEGKNIALVTDAGTPGISDPGNMLISYISERDESITISPIPGASALTAALSVSGFPTDKFIFLGFPPHKKRRNQFFQTIADADYTVAFFESNHRIKKALGTLEDVLPADAQLCICRELTKAFESVYRGTIEEIQQMDIPEKGEFVVIVRK